MSYELQPQTTEALASIGDLSVAAELLWTSAATAAPDQYSGFSVGHTDGRAEFTMTYSPTAYDKLTIFQSGAGGWCIEEQRQMPTLENEGFGQTVRHTSTYPLVAEEPPTIIREQGLLQNDGSIAHAQFDTSFGEPLNDKARERLLATLRTVRGEDTPQMRTPGKGWLRRVLKL